MDLAGDPDTAGFVQVMQGRTRDARRAGELMAQNKEARMAFRPDVLGTVYVVQEGGLWTLAIYFTSEQAAREGERKEPPPELAAEMEEAEQALPRGCRSSSTSRTRGCTLRQVRRLR